MIQLNYLIRLFIIGLLLQSLQLKAQTVSTYELRSQLFFNSIPNDYIANFPDGYKGRNNNFSLTFGVAKKFKPNFLFGLDIQYNLSKYKISPEGKIPSRVYTSTGLNYFTNFQVQIDKISTYSPVIYLSYINAFSERISFALDIYTKYDFSIYKDKSINYSPDREMLFSDSPYIDYIKHVDVSKSKKHFLNFGLKPRLRFNIINNIGIEFTFGFAEFSMQTHGSRYDQSGIGESDFYINLKPENWMLGFWFKL